MARLVLVATSSRLPGLFPFQSWEVLDGAEHVYARDPSSHPSAPYLELAGLSLHRLQPERAPITGVDLLKSSPGEQGLVRALVASSEREGELVYLLGPDDRDPFIRAAATGATEAGLELEFVFHTEPPGTEVLRLVEVERELRDPETGCPWDLEQDHASLGRYLVEETYELLEAIEAGDDIGTAEELGDVLLQVVFHAQMASDRDAFDIDDVARGIADKLVRRHPHVFSDAKVADSAEVKARWDELKQEEKQRTGPFDGVPTALPALQLADKLISRASKIGFAWPDRSGAVAKVREELTEVEEAVAAGDAEARQREVGDLLAAVVALARHLDVDPEAALRGSATTFRARVERAVDAAATEGRSPDDLSASEWMSLWESTR